MIGFVVWIALDSVIWKFTFIFICMQKSIWMISHLLSRKEQSVQALWLMLFAHIVIKASFLFSQTNKLGPCNRQQFSPVIYALSFTWLSLYERKVASAKELSIWIELFIHLFQKHQIATYYIASKCHHSYYYYYFSCCCTYNASSFFIIFLL